MENESYLDIISSKAVEITTTYGPKLLMALLTLFIGLWLIKRLKKYINRSFEKSGMESSLKSFLSSLTVNLLKILLGISVLSMLNVEMTSFIAILGAAGLAIGLALSGTLQNFAGGVMILLFKPFKIGDFITAQGFSGTVKEIQIFVTILNTPDNKRIIIPNGPLANGSMTNFSSEATRRVDWAVGIGYGDDYDKAIEVLKKFIAEEERILKDPEPFLALSELADSSVNIAMRCWVNPSDYWGVFFKMNERIYKEFGENGLNIPFPQMDVHVHQNK